MNNKFRRDIIILAALIIGCSFLARFMARGETLAEYAAKNQSASDSTTHVTDSDTSEHSNNASEIPKSDSHDSSYDKSASLSSDSPSDKSASFSSGASSDKTSSDNTIVSSSKEASQASNTGSGQDITEAVTDRVTYSQGFYYEPLPEDVINRITGISYVENDNVSLEDLRYIVLLYNDFNGETKSGEMICNKQIAQDVIEIFYELYTSGYQIESIKLIDEFGGDDTASMLANNTSSFNYRVVENTTRLSNHAYGLAIDLNPFYNPYITYGKDGSVHISPEGSEPYADRSQTFPYKIDENDLAYKLFKAHGFKWGGDWNSVKDYQHFERSN